MPNQGKSPRPRWRSRALGRLDRPRRRLGGKSIWEWLDLSSKYAVPLTVALAAGTFGLWQTHQNNLQHQRDDQITQEQHKFDRQLALDQQRAAVLQTYMDNIRDLLLNHNLAKSAPRDEVSQVARVQTLTTLRSLDSDRNKIVVQFLQDAGLIRTGDAINLSNADLSNDNLNGANLSGIELNNATLTGAHLHDANLSGAALYNASLDATDLSGANLSDASLLDGRLNSANLNAAELTNVNLTDAILGSAEINRATFGGARLNGALLNGAQLNDARLNGAQLFGTDLKGASLNGADLSGDNLSGTDLTQQQLDTVNSCTNAILTPGLKCRLRPTTTLTYWYTESPAEAPVILKLIRQFEQQNPTIHINAVNTNYYRTETAFKNAAEAGNAPDVLRSDVSWVAKLASQGYLLNIDPYISQGILSDYLSTPFRSDQYNGHYYGLPQVTDFLALLYNKAELKNAGIASPPRTMNDFQADAMKVVHDRAAKYGFETDGTGYNVLPFLYAFGGGMLDQHNNILVKDAGSVNGLNFLLRLQNTDKVMPASVGFSNGPVLPTVYQFKSGETAMIFGGPYNVPEILTGPSFKDNPSNLGIASIPTCYAGIPTCRAGKTGSPTGGQSYVISAGTEHPSQAYRFISFMSSTRSQIEIAEANHTLPTRWSAYQDNRVSGERFTSEFLRIESTAVAQPDIPQAGYLFDALDPNIAAALDGAESPTAALNAVADAWRQLLAVS